MAWHHCRRSCRCSGVKGSARKGPLDFKICFCKVSKYCLWNNCYTYVCSYRERVTVGCTKACRTILRSSLLVVFLVAPDPVFLSWVPSRVNSNNF
ncbi:uncharacterized protein TNCV_561391 [Trichonephila clavipes]|uniref:Uncharacterized protein n=1 Tax=Trichonephila clavipes TaxID=2585209 RepID=A0A8X6S8Y6_TRICX|nr:uncharacterized protein TNCV_561391 [Trichonephila clavipes]